MANILQEVLDSDDNREEDDLSSDDSCDNVHIISSWSCEEKEDSDSRNVTAKLMPSTSSYTKVNGQQLMTASLSTSRVLNSSSLNVALPIAFLKHCFTFFTMCSQKPPHHGALATINFHVVQWLDR